MSGEPRPDPDETARLYTLSRRLVEIHDAEGFPLDVQLQMAAERGVRVLLLGLLVEMAHRGWGKARVREVVRQWSRLWTPTPAEQQSVDFILAEEE